VGIIALVIILFAGGLDTRWSEAKPVFWQATSLATLGVLVTALAVGLFASIVLKISLLSGLLLGAVVSSTDAAAVFAVLRAKNVSLRRQLKPLLELESGSNDPMAVFLTIGLIQLLTNPATSMGSIALLFVVQMGLGALIGFAFGRAMVIVLNHLRFSYEGIYPVVSLAFAALIYGLTSAIGGSGFLAVYVAALGLLAFPSHIVPVVGAGLLVSAFLMFIARPLSVFLSLSLAKLNVREKIFVSWVGLRGAVPIILATFPLLAGLPDDELIFNIVFFIVLTSAILQGWSIPVVARLLHLDAPLERKRRSPIEFAPEEGVDTELVDLIVPYNAAVTGKSIVELGLPQDSLVVLISRADSYLVPSGGTVLQEGDTILVLVNKSNLPEVRAVLSGVHAPATADPPPRAG
jgi:cell volume regulation protein A